MPALAQKKGPRNVDDQDPLELDQKKEPKNVDDQDPLELAQRKAPKIPTLPALAQSLIEPHRRPKEQKEEA